MHFPDIFLLAAGRFSPTVEPSSCLVFEDATSGVLAAAAAGMQSVLVPDAAAGAAVTPESAASATQLLTTLEDFHPEDFGLPPF